MESTTLRSRIAIAVLCLGLFPLALVTYNHLGEDAFITYRYVEQFAGGHGLVYNRGEIVEGFSNPFWLLVLTPAAWAGLKLHVAARLLTVAFLAGLVCTSWLAAQRLVGEKNRWLAWWLPLAIALTPILNYHRDRGLETVSYAALMAGMLLVFGMRAWILAAVAGCFVSISRPEGLAFVIALWPAAAWEIWRTRSQRSWWRPAAFVAGPLLFWLMIELGRRVYFDNWVPNTVTAKAGGAAGWRELLRLVLSWWGMPVLGFAGAALAFRRDRKDLLALGTGLLIAAAAAFQLKIGDVLSAGFRYSAPIVVPSLIGVWLLLREVGSCVRPAVLKIAAGTLLALSLWMPYLEGSAYIVGLRGEGPGARLPSRVARFLTTWDLGTRWEWFFHDPILLNAEAGRWVRDELVPEHPGALLAADQMGMLGFYVPPETHIVDMLGLMDRHVATYRLMGIDLARYLEERDVSFILLYCWGPKPLEGWIGPDDVNRAAVPYLRPTVEETPGRELWAPWYYVRPRNDLEAVQFVVYGPTEGAPTEPQIILVGETTEEMKRLWGI
ncbi:hypothetical protein KQI84_03735 [bacterium]|nr:hypothetical protein [bacterium]